MDRDPASSSDRDLVSIILGRKVHDHVIDGLLASAFGTTEGLAMEPTAVPYAHVRKLEAALELSRRINAVEAARNKVCLACEEDVFDLMKPLYLGQKRELFYCISLDTKNHIIEITHVSTGSLDASIVHPRELYRRAVQVSAKSVIVCHNHPSGDPTPSGADIQLTRRLAKAGDVLGIELLDHIVIGDTGVSLRDSGLM